jgi:hypothetical protein
MTVLLCPPSVSVIAIRKNLAYANRRGKAALEQIGRLGIQTPLFGTQALQVPGSHPEAEAPARLICPAVGCSFSPGKHPTAQHGQTGLVLGKSPPNGLLLGSSIMYVNSL